MQRGQSVLKKIIPLLLILAFAIAGAIVLFKTKPQAPPTESEEKIWAVTTQIADPKQNTPAISLYGRVESAQQSRLTSSLNTTVQEVLCREGQRVEKGQPLVRLDARDAQLRLQQRSAELAEIRALLTSENTRFDSDQKILKDERQLLTLAQQEVTRAQRLKKDKLAAQTLIDQAQQVRLRQDIAVAQRQSAVRDHKARMNRLQAQFKKAESLHALAELDIEHTVLTAPFNARITDVPASPGNRTRPGEVLVELYAVDALQVRAQIPNAKLTAVETALASGHPLMANAHTSSQQTLELQLTHLAGDIKPKRGGRDGLFELNTPGINLAVGSIIALQLQLPAVDDTLALPREALYGSKRIYSIVDGRLKGHQVERLGETPAGRESLLLVRSASIVPGDVIVTTQLPNAVEGLKVRPRSTTNHE